MSLAQTLRATLELGRASNLPTVWSNTLTGVVLGGASLSDARLPLLLVVFSLFYTGGMFLNDAFDREFDRRHRPLRPIPSGRVRVATVFVAGFGLLAAALVLLAAVTMAGAHPAWPAVLSGLALAAAIVLYDRRHKDNRYAPLLMAACRVLVYLTAALAVTAAPDATLLIAGGVLYAHVIGLSVAARAEHLDRRLRGWPLLLLSAAPLYGLIAALQLSWVWPFAGLLVAIIWYAYRLLARGAAGDTQRAVARLIAAIALIDAVILAAAGAVEAAGAAVGAFALTLLLQRYVAGT